LDHCLKEDVDIVYIDEIKDNFEDAVPLIFDLAAGNSLVIIEINSTSSVRVIEKILDAARKKISPEAARYSLADVLIGVITQYLIPSRSGGLVPAYEILISNSAVKSLIRDSKIYQIDSTIQTSRGEGMVSMKKYIDELLIKGKITQEEVDKLKLK
jgi:twitching motility protein PilT